MEKKIEGDSPENMRKYPARLLEYRDFNPDDVLTCPVCGWHGTSHGNIETHDVLLDVCCPKCDKMLLVVSYPMLGGQQ